MERAERTERALQRSEKRAPLREAQTNVGFGIVIAGIVGGAAWFFNTRVKEYESARADYTDRRYEIERKLRKLRAKKKKRL